MHIVNLVQVACVEHFALPCATVRCGGPRRGGAAARDVAVRRRGVAELRCATAWWRAAVRCGGGTVRCGVAMAQWWCGGAVRRWNGAVARGTAEVLQL